MNAPSHTSVTTPASGNTALQPVLIGIGLLALLVAPMLFYPFFLMQLLCYALFASAFNLLLGYAGLLSFGHAAFFGGAAYFVGHAAKEWGFPPELALLTGIVGAALLGLVMGGLAIRRHGIYFSMITLALAQMFYFLCLRAPFTHGEDGLQAIPRGLVLGFIDLRDNTTMYYFVLVLFVLAIALIWRIINSPFGMILHSIRENEQRSTSLGYSVARYKLAVFVMSAALSGLAGGMMALVNGFATLESVRWHASGDVILMTLLGGIGTVIGPIFGAGALTWLRNYLATSGFPATIVTGMVFMVCVLLFRRGFIGEIYASRLGRLIGINFRR